MTEISVPLFMYGLGFISGMIFVWAFGAAHDAIINNYREMVFNRKVKAERENLTKDSSDCTKQE